MTTTPTPQENIQTTEGDPETNTMASFPVTEEENDTNMPNDEREDGAKKRYKSSVWEHFVRLPVNQTKGEPQEMCKYCLSMIAFHPTSHGTNEMQIHVHKYPENPNRADKSTQSSSAGSEQGSTESEFHQDPCKKALAKFLILDGRPFQTVEGEGFKELLRSLEPRFQIPSRVMVVRDCLKLYLEEARNLKRYFKKSKVCVSLSIDIWTSNQNSNYLCLSAHWIDKDWIFQKRILNFLEVEYHESDTFVEEIEKCLLSWSIDKVFTITFDDTSSNDIVVASLHRVLKKWNGCDGDFLHLRCSAHILNLVVSDAVKDMHKCIDGIRNAIKYVRSSPARFQKFKELAEEMKIDRNCLLSVDCPTRWNSTYMMLENAIKFSGVFERMEQEDMDYINNFLDKKLIRPPDNLDWKDAKYFVISLKAFYKFSMDLSGSPYLTSDVCFHHIVDVFATLNEYTNSHNSLICNMAKRMQSKYNGYWGNLESLNPLLMIAVVLDPRLKMKFLKFALKQMSLDDVQCEAISKKVSDALYRLYDHYSSGIDTSQSKSQSQTQVVASGNSSLISSRKALTTPMRKLLAEIESQKPKGKYAEVEKYLKALIDDARDPKFDLLAWWKVNTSQYKVLSLIACDVLAIPVCSMTSKSVFNMAGCIIDEFKSSLSSKMVEALICAQSWLSPPTAELKGLDCDNFNDTENAIHAVLVASNISKQRKNKNERISKCCVVD